MSVSLMLGFQLDFTFVPVGTVFVNPVTYDPTFIIMKLFYCVLLCR